MGLRLTARNRDASSSASVSACTSERPEVDQLFGAPACDDFVGCQPRSGPELPAECMTGGHVTPGEWGSAPA